MLSECFCNNLWMDNLKSKDNGVDKCSECYRGIDCHLKKLKDYCGGPFKDYEEHKDYLKNERMKHGNN